jgi:hypothetical protein
VLPPSGMLEVAKTLITAGLREIWVGKPVSTEVVLLPNNGTTIVVPGIRNVVGRLAGSEKNTPKAFPRNVPTTNSSITFELPGSVQTPEFQLQLEPPIVPHHHTASELPPIFPEVNPESPEYETVMGPFESSMETVGIACAWYPKPTIHITASANVPRNLLIIFASAMNLSIHLTIPMAYAANCWYIT